MVKNSRAGVAYLFWDNVTFPRQHNGSPMELIDWLRGESTMQRVQRKVVAVTLFTASQLSQATVAEIKQRLNVTLTEDEMRSVFLLYAFFNIHLVDLTACQLLVSNLAEFRKGVRSGCVTKFVEFALEKPTADSERAQLARSVDSALGDFMYDFTEYRIPANSQSSMSPGSLPWELGRRIAGEISLLGDNEAAITPGWIGGVASMKQLDTVAAIIRPLRD